MKAIVTGGLGFIGHNLLTELQKQNWEVMSIDDGFTGHFIIDGITNNYVHIKDSRSVISGLISDFQPDVIFHEAAWPKVSLSVERPFGTFENNMMSTLGLLDVIRKNNLNCRFVFASSSSVYGGANSGAVKESDALNPKSPYALQKMQSEQWCKMYSDIYGLDTCCLRYFNVFGPYSMCGGSYSAVLAAWLYAAFVNKTSKPFLEGDGFQTRDFCYIDNIVQANILAGTHSEKFSGDIFNVAQGKVHSLQYVKLLIEKISGSKLDLELRPTRVGDVRSSCANIDKAKSILGYNPDTDFDGQVEKMAMWYKDHYNEYK